MKTIRDIPEYYREICLPPPKYPSFHVGRHEENLATISRKQKPIKHELYSISLITSDVGDPGLDINKAAVKFRMFIISPYKEISWDITDQKLKGIYFIFDRSFIKSNPLWNNFLQNFPFFKTNNQVTADIPDELLSELHHSLERIHTEYHLNPAPSFQIITGYVHLVFLLVKRHFSHQKQMNTEVSHSYRILSNFESLLLESLERMPVSQNMRKASFYANKLNVHVNHLNATLKQVTGKTTSEIIHDHIIHHAGLLIRQTDTPIKELAAHFHFSDPTHFTAFFKRHTGLTPKQYKQSLLT